MDDYNVDGNLNVEIYKKNKIDIENMFNVWQKKGNLKLDIRSL